MNNQAAQTMPELPDSQYRGGNDVFGKEFPLYTADQMHQYARDYAASQTAGVAEGCVSIPKHYAENIGYAAAMLENSESVIDRHNAPALRSLVSLMLASAPAASGGECAALHPATDDLVRRFSDALRAKLAAAEMKYGYSDGWASPDWMDECRKHLMQHIAKGDPRDVAAYCAFLWHHGESTTPQPPAAASVSERARVTQAMLDAGTSAMIEFRKSGGDWTDKPAHAAEVVIRAALEQALTQQWVCPACASATESYCCACGWASVESTPQPSADAVRELVKRAIAALTSHDQFNWALADPTLVDDLNTITEGLSAASGEKGVVGA